MPRWVEGPSPAPTRRTKIARSARPPRDGAERQVGFTGDRGRELLNTLSLVLASGGAMLFGMTRSGDAYLIRAWIGGDPYEDYCTSPAEWDDVMQAHRDAAEAVMAQGPSPEP
jgi:hypothetical protein